MKKETYIKLIGIYIPLCTCFVSAFLNTLYIYGYISISASFIIGLVAVVAMTVYFRTWCFHGSGRVGRLNVLTRILIVIWIVSAIISGAFFIIR